MPSKRARGGCYSTLDFTPPKDWRTSTYCLKHRFDGEFGACSSWPEELWALSLGGGRDISLLPPRGEGTAIPLARLSLEIGPFSRDSISLQLALRGSLGSWLSDERRSGSASSSFGGSPNDGGDPVTADGRQIWGADNMVGAGGGKGSSGLSPSANRWGR